MKKITRAGILSLTFVLVFMFAMAFAEIAIASRFFPLFTQSTQIQARHDYDYQDYQIVHLNKHELTLNKGQTYTLKAYILPSGKSVSVKWISSNPKIAKVSSSGKVTAIAPGSVMIMAGSNEYAEFLDETGYSAECYITVQGGAKDVKPMGISDRTYSYGKYTFTAVTSKQSEALAKIKKSIGGYTFNGDEFGIGLLLGSNDESKAHTGFFVADNYLYRFVAREKSPIKTSRGIMVGAKKSTVQQKYGLPTMINQYEENEKTYELIYTTKAPGKNLYTSLNFAFLKSNDTVYLINFYLGAFGDY